MIQEPNRNPSGIFSTIVLRCRSLVTCVSCKNVGGSGLKVKILDAVNIKGGEDEVEGKDGYIDSRNLQFANLALYKFMWLKLGIGYISVFLAVRFYCVSLRFGKKDPHLTSKYADV